MKKNVNKIENKNFPCTFSIENSESIREWPTIELDSSKFYFLSN